MGPNKVVVNGDVLKLGRVAIRPKHLLVPKEGRATCHLVVLSSPLLWVPLITVRGYALRGGLQIDRHYVHFIPALSCPVGLLLRTWAWQLVQEKLNFLIGRLKGFVYLRLRTASKINLLQSSADLEEGYSQIYVLLLRL